MNRPCREVRQNTIEKTNKTRNKEKKSPLKENEIDNLKNEEQNKESMNEKVHYEIKFVETEDGYRLEASGDKDALRRLGIGPNMVGKRRGRGQGRRGNGRRGAMAQRNRRMNRRMRFAMQGGRGPGFGPQGQSRGPQGRWQQDGGPGQGPNPWPRDTWDW